MRRSIRKIGLSQRIQDCELFQDNKVNDDGDFFNFALMVESEPVKMEEALSDPKWICVVKDELEFIEKNKNWDLVDLPNGMKSIGVRWVFKVKENPNGKIIKHKTGLIAKGFLQRECMDLEEVFASVARIKTIMLVIGIANKKK
ncbi:uncharacterized mitochondrial protein AtMg00820-like [Lathyrus oleraceus]|uniref:uncharacterized mitochondrial protein AtMg00820-like n=1 Tax=Pisum sativum TaxID=3888 RepID=UPI0021D15AE8|nr:uncharacterized mitochondrial protein AtMg00820-like [Pisum sativum]